MKKKLSLLLLGLVAVQPLAFAEKIEGYVVSVNPTSNILTINRTDKGAALKSTVTVMVKEDAKIKNADSLTAVLPGDRVKVQVQRFGKNVDVEVAIGEPDHVGVFGERL